jgi:methionyl-tRNA formyltransferase
MKNLKIVFMGTADFAVPSLRTIHGSRHEVVGVVTALDLPRGRGQKVTYTPVKEFALENSIPILQPNPDPLADGGFRNPGFLHALRQFEADLFIVVAFRILPPEVFEIPPLGCVNLHASLLPKFRGAAPINWAIVRGEKETGVTTFFIQKKVDTGNMILQKKTAIGENDTAGELHDRLALLGAETVLETIDLIADDRAAILPQDESRVSTAPKLFKEDCVIRWDRPAEEIRNFIHGLSPHPAAVTHLDRAPYKIFRARADEEPFQESFPAGTVVKTDQERGIGVLCGDNRILWITEIQPESKNRMTAAEYLRGHPLEKFKTFE